MMSRVPMGSNGGDLSDALHERWQIVPQGISAEVLAEEWGFSREELDAYSLESHRRAVAAIDEGRFERELVPVEVSNPHVGTLVGVDETPRRDTSAEALAALKPAFARRRSSDRGQLQPDLRRCRRPARGERACLRAPRARRRGLDSSRSASPASIRTGCCTATRRRARRRSGAPGIGWGDVGVIEVNEAFASVVLQFAHDAGLEDRWDDINPNGGGISLGHPLGATGVRMTATLLGELERRGERYGVATMCIGFGQAIAAVIERV